MWRFMQPLQKLPNLSLPYPLPVLTAMLLMPEQNKSHVIVAVFWHYLFLPFQTILRRKFCWSNFFDTTSCLTALGGQGVVVTQENDLTSFLATLDNLEKIFFVIKILYHYLIASPSPSLSHSVNGHIEFVHIWFVKVVTWICLLQLLDVFVKIDKVVRCICQNR